MMSVVLLVLVVVLLIEMVLRPDPLPFYRRFGCPIVYSLGPVFVKVPTGSSAGGPYNSMGSSEPACTSPVNQLLRIVGGGWMQRKCRCPGACPSFHFIGRIESRWPAGYQSQ